MSLFANLAAITADINVSVDSEDTPVDQPIVTPDNDVVSEEDDTAVEKENAVDEVIEEESDNIEELSEEVEMCISDINALTAIQSMISKHGVDRTMFEMVLKPNPILRRTIAGKESFTGIIRPDEVSMEGFSEAISNLNERIGNIFEKVSDSFRKLTDTILSVLPRYENKMKELNNFNFSTVDIEKFENTSLNTLPFKLVLANMDLLTIGIDCAREIDALSLKLITDMEKNKEINEKEFDASIDKVISGINKRIENTGYAVRRQGAKIVWVQLRSWIKKTKQSIKDHGYSVATIKSARTDVVKAIAAMRNVVSSTDSTRKLKKYADSLSRSQTGRSSDQIRTCIKYLNSLNTVRIMMLVDQCFENRTAINAFFKVTDTMTRCVKK